VFKHTVEKRRGLTHIAVSAARDGGQLVLGVEDDSGILMPESAGVPGLASASTGGCGIGLANLRARLAALYGERAALSLAARDGGGVRAELRLPCAS
jgi:LytS/YehU family sensor histidine kinase